MRERRQSVRARAGCSRPADLLEAEPDLEALSFYPHLLAWDLAQLMAGKSALPVILLDPFEDSGGRTHRDKDLQEATEGRRDIGERKCRRRR
ncbi:hypothetical protein [Streptomyces sp. NPDC052107]|uniref:hypothetical protein n=1 Tax=Streptomyces sp. NPDC052107 TaxID=3155632 RepID=UPI003419672B